MTICRAHLHSGTGYRLDLISYILAGGGVLGGTGEGFIGVASLRGLNPLLHSPGQVLYLYASVAS